MANRLGKKWVAFIFVAAGTLITFPSLGVVVAGTSADAATPSSPTTFSGSCSTKTFSANHGKFESEVTFSSGTCTGSVDSDLASTWTILYGQMFFSGDQLDPISAGLLPILDQYPGPAIELGAVSSGLGFLELCQSTCVELNFKAFEIGDLFFLSGDSSGYAYLAQSPILLAYQGTYAGHLATLGALAG